MVAVMVLPVVVSHTGWDLLSLSAGEPVGWVMCELVVALGGDNCQPECGQAN